MGFFRKTHEQPVELTLEEKMFQKRFNEVKARLRTTDGDHILGEKEITENITKILEKFVLYQQNFDSADFATRGNKPTRGILGDAEMRKKWLDEMNQCRADLAKEGFYILDRDIEKKRSAAETNEDNDHDMPMAAA